MIISVGATAKQKWYILNVWTHNGIFHPDDVTGVSIYELAHTDSNIHIVRAENIESDNVDIAIDIGGGKFDHHMKGFNERRASGEKYASAGLVWRQFAENVIHNVAKEIGITIFDEEVVQSIKEQIDEEVMRPIDLEDNGKLDKKKVEKHLFSFIVSQILPVWTEEQGADTYNTAFMRAERIISDILKGLIKDRIVQILTEKFWLKFMSKEKNVAPCLSSIQNGILELPAQTIDWKAQVISFNKEHGDIIKFVIFPYPRGGWAAQCVPPSMEEEWAQLVPFPETWAGENRDTLPDISGVVEATGCHKDRFFARAETREAIIEMCKIAMSMA